MPRPTKEHKALNCKLELEVYIELENFSKETGITKTAAVEKALKEYIKKYQATGKI